MKSSIVPVVRLRLFLRDESASCFFLAMLILFLFIAGGARAENEIPKPSLNVEAVSPGADGSTSSAPSANAVNLSEILEESERINKAVNKLLEEQPPGGPEALDIDALSRRIEQSRNKILAMYARNSLSFEELNQSQAEWRREKYSIDQSFAELKARIATLQAAKSQLEEELSKWRLTVQDFEKNGITGVPLERAQKTVSILENAIEELDNRLPPLLSSQEKLFQVSEEIGAHIEFINQMQAKLKKTIWQRDWAPVVSVEFLRSLRQIDLDELAMELESLYVNASEYFAANRWKFIFFLVLALGAWGWLRATLPEARKRTENIPQIEEVRALFSKPLLFALLLTCFLATVAYRGMPLLVRNIYWLTLTVLVVFFFINILKERVFKIFIFGMGGTNLISLLREMVMFAPALERALFIMQLGLGLAMIFIICRRGRLLDYARSRGVKYLKTLQLVQWLLMGGLFLVLTAEISGLHRLATLVGRGIFHSIYITLVAAVGYWILRSLLIHLLFSPPLNKVSLVRAHVLDIIGWCQKWVYLAGAVAWIYLLAGIWHLSDPLHAAVFALVKYGFTLGKTKITIAAIAGAVIAIYLSIKLSRIITVVLNEEVYPRRGIHEGLRDAINQGIFYGLGLAGIIIAMGLLGVSLHSIAIIGGALGIGIGFGLQNIINNFVSGIIMLLERPVKTGDVLEIDGIWGTVTHIGIRATTIKTWDNSEIIIPNGDMLWTKVVNWTHTNTINRIVVQVGVAYGSDVEKVLKILEKIAYEHPEVLTDPKPLILFTGFGESSLDFEIRCYLPSVDGRLRVASEIRTRIYEAFEENNITIPFPQRDIWFRNFPENPQ